jgi:hypothetical protein
MATKSVEQRASEAIKGFSGVRTTQDAVDQMAAELYTAELLRSNANARYDDAKGNIMENNELTIGLVRSRATSYMKKYTDYTDGVDWRIEFNANTPSKRVSVDELRTELVRRGVKVDLIDECIAKVEKLSTPATIIKAIPLVKKQEVA